MLNPLPLLLKANYEHSVFCSLIFMLWEIMLIKEGNFFFFIKSIPILEKLNNC